MKVCQWWKFYVRHLTKAAALWHCVLKPKAQSGIYRSCDLLVAVFFFKWRKQYLLQTFGSLRVALPAFVHCLFLPSVRVESGFGCCSNADSKRSKVLVYAFVGVH